MNNNSKKANINPMKVITGPDTRWSYANVWEAKSINGGTPKFSVSLIIPKSDTRTIAKIKAAIEAAYREGEAKLKGNGRSVPPYPLLKLRSVTEMLNAQMILRTPIHILSMRIPQPLQVSWMPTATQF